MKFQLEKLILWPIDRTKKPRVISFKPGKLNVITGASRTGKSAIIPIIDYCFASSKCSIPVHIIRDSCAWFGIIVQLNDGKILLARESPYKNNSSNKMFRLRDKEIDIPIQISDPNTTVSEVKSLLNGIAGIPYLRMDADDSGGGFSSHASFRDLISLNFQPQNIVANQNVLFYKTESYQYRERLKSVFPYALGIITAEILAKQYELKKLRRLLQQKENEYKKLRQVSERWIANLKSNVSRAVEYGMWPAKENDHSSDAEYLVSVLQSLSRDPELKLTISEESIDKTTVKIKELWIREHDLSTQLAEQRSNKSELDKLKFTLRNHSNITSLKRDRLKLSEWLLNMVDSEKTCPVCGEMFASETEELKMLCNAFHDFELQAHSSIEIPSAFHREYENVKEDIRKSAEDINSVQTQIQALQVSSEKQKNERYKRDEALRFIGALENSLKTYEEVQDDGGLMEEIVSLRKQVQNLRDGVSERQISQRMKATLKAISISISSILPFLDIGEIYTKAPCELSIPDLSLKISLDTGTRYFLSEIGSGSNWVSYHIALTIALHRHFAMDANSPVAGFIVYDQPSQVYFPRRLADEGKDITGENNNDIDRAKDFRDEDVEAVKKIFATLATAISKDNKKWQGLILDHAPESIWGDIPNIYKVAEWRDGEKLIPYDWYVS